MTGIAVVVVVVVVVGFDVAVTGAIVVVTVVGTVVDFAVVVVVVTAYGTGVDVLEAVMTRPILELLLVLMSPIWLGILLYYDVFNFPMTQSKTTPVAVYSTLFPVL